MRPRSPPHAQGGSFRALVKVTTVDNPEMIVHLGLLLLSGERVAG